MEKQKIGISVRWRDSQDKRKWDGEILLDLETSVPIQQFRNCHWCLFYPGNGQGNFWNGRYSFTLESQEAAEIFVIRFKSIAKFMEFTGWRPSKASRRFFGESLYHLPKIGFDHTLVWRDAEKRIFATTEPYGGNAKIVRDVNPAFIVTKELPSEIGMWFPPSTTLFLVAKPINMHCLEQAYERIVCQWGRGG